MKALFNALDFLWNLRFIKGHRTQVARALIAGVAFYQWVSVAPQALPNLPDLPEAWSAPILLYLAAKIAQFANEH